jgi:multisubunit Na+/H+ antiporter MnhG subunit
MVRAVIIDCLLGVAVLCCWVGCIGMVRMRDALQSLHYLAPAATLAFASLAAAMWLQAGWSGSVLKVILIALTFGASGSVSTHAVARAFWLRDSTQSGVARRVIGSEDQ